MVIKGRVFGDHWKVVEGLSIRHILDNYILSKVSKQIATENAEN